MPAHASAKLALLAGLIALTHASPALGCGASAGGVTGVSGCSLAEHEEEARKKWRIGAGYAFTSTTIVFDDDVEVDQTRQVALASLAYRPTRTWTLELGLGSILAGDLEGGGVRDDFEPGPVVALGASWRVVEPEHARPFVLLTGQAAYVDAPTVSHDAADARAARYRAFDLRLGVAAGWPIAQTFSPYAVARAFGGPVFWRFEGRSETGTDLYHYQLGAGLSLLLARTVDLYVEGIPLGERGIAAGAGLTF